MVRHDGSEDNTLGPDDCKAHGCPFHKLELYEIGELPVLALFTVGDVYVSFCKRGAYAPFGAQRRSRALFWL